MLKLLIVAVFLISLFIESFSQNDSLNSTTRQGYSFGAVPVVAYNTDKGFQYGIAASIFNFGDGSYYPNYKHSLYLEWSRTTKQSGLNQLIFDFKDLFKTKLRLLSEVSYITDKLLPFYGFNGYDAYYNSDYELRNKQGYISRAYYRLDRSLLRITSDLQGALPFHNYRWVGGLGFLDFKIKTVDIKNINSTLAVDEKLPDVPSLYDEYVNAGIITQQEKDGGSFLFLKAGIVYDTRDNEANPAKGTWSELVLLNVPTILKSSYSYTDLIFVHRHYFTIIKPCLTLANRIGFQGLVAGKKPFFVLPFHFNSYRILEAFGGVKTIRGLMANRLIGNGVLFGNFEFRYKFMNTRIFNQDFYISGNSFVDWGTIVQKYKIEDSLKDQVRDIIKDREKLHYTAGAGLRFAFNQNFIIAVDYGKAFDRADGNQALYIALDFLY